LGKRVLDEVTFNTMKLFEMITHIFPVDCIVNDTTVLFVVKKGLLRKCVGREGIMIKKLNEKLNKKIWIVEQYSEVKGFIKGLMVNIPIVSLNVQDNTVYVTIPLKYRGYAIGKEGSVIKRNKEIVKRLYSMEMKLITK
jgi:NusA-like KH domain protein